MRVPAGYTTLHWFSDKDTLELVAKDKGGKEVRRMKDVRVPFPKPEAVNEACKDLVFVLTDEAGESYTYNGPAAAVARAYKHAMEQLRGAMRQKHKDGSFKFTDKQIRDAAAGFSKIAGRTTLGVDVEAAKKEAEAEVLKKALAKASEKGADPAAIKRWLEEQIKAMA